MELKRKNAFYFNFNYIKPTKKFNGAVKKADNLTRF